LISKGAAQTAPFFYDDDSRGRLSFCLERQLEEESALAACSHSYMSSRDSRW